MLSARLPGIRFENRLQAVSSDLPRMDIAAFVGFATAGPLNIPVAIDAPVRFREIFGPDPALAWDAARRQVRYGSLGGCVENFFANGGRRCWIVRTANPDAIAHHRFSLPGISIGKDDGTASGSAEVLARAPGSWCEDLSVGTRLVREVIPLRLFAIDDEETSDPGPLDLDAVRYRIDLIANPASFETGELLEIFFTDELPRLWLFLASVEPQPGFVRVKGYAEQNAGHTVGAYWVKKLSSLEPAFVTLSETAARSALLTAGVFDAVADWRTTPLTATVSARRLRLELLVWENTGLVARLGDLGLARQHTRCWARLPTDAALLGSPSLSRAPREPQALDNEVNSPRFPLAGPYDTENDIPAFSLPLAVADTLNNKLAWGLSALNGTALERDGLANFDASLFVDPSLASLRGSLLNEAEHRYYVRKQDLMGMHSLLPVGEISLLGVPDAHHSGWTRQFPPTEAPLPAPVLSSIPTTTLDASYDIAWTNVPLATGYLLERDEDPDFTNALTLYDGADNTITMYLEIDCPRRYFFRVRARRYDELSTWSNTRQALLPAPQFNPCAENAPAELELTLQTAYSPPAQHLTWMGSDDAAGAACYELQEAANADFIGAVSTLTYATDTVVERASNTGVDLESRRYFRVRGINADRRGPFSNTVIVEPYQRVSWALQSEDDYDDTVLLAVHRALLRFTAARADMFALLSLPLHYRAAEAMSHVGKLTAGGGENVRGHTHTGVVPPLSYGEHFVLSYGALIHPWLTVRIPDRGVAREEITVALPPDGAVAGSMADLALQRGAWLAPANRVLHRVLATYPPLDLEDWRQLTPSHVNVVLRSPRGYSLFSESTLSTDESFAQIHIRRLMILLRRLALREGDRFVFAPHDDHLQHRVRHRFEVMLANLYTLGAFAGKDPASAFRVITDGTVNTTASREQGRFIVELRVAPAQALTFITVRLVTDERGRLAVMEV